MALGRGRTCPICHRSMNRFQDDDGNDEWRCLSSSDEQHEVYEEKKAVRHLGRRKGSKNKPKVESPDPKFQDQPREKGNGRRRRRKREEGTEEET